MLADSRRHVTLAEACAWLAEVGEAIHLTTVYRTLVTLTGAGLAHAVPSPGAMRYGLTGSPHHHTVCQQCGEVADIASEDLSEAVGKIEELTGLRPLAGGSLLVYGCCSQCSSSGAQAT